MLIRPATLADADAIAVIYNDAIVNSTAILWHAPKPASLWRGRLTDRPSRFPVLVAEDESGAVVGFALLGPYDDKCGYDDVAEWSLYIDADHRGRGVGRALAEALFAKARADQELHSVVSRVTEGNEVSFKLHDRLGFTKVGTFRKLGHKFGKRHDVIVYQLLL